MATVYEDDFFLLEFEGVEEAVDEEQDEVVSAAKRMGRHAATLVQGNGTTRAGTGPLELGWAACIEKLRVSESPSERVGYLSALATLAQVVAHGDAMREAGVVTACTEALRDTTEPVQVAAADAIRHLACANNGNRIAAREAGAIPLLVAMLTRVAESADFATALSGGGAASGGGGGGGGGGAGAGAGAAGAASAAAAPPAASVDNSPTTLSSSGAALVVTAATAALRNLSFQNGPNRDLIRFSGGLAPLIRIVAQGSPPVPPPRGAPQREAAYRAAGALENLSGDNPENAAAIVAAGVVPAMKELLVGLAAADLSQKAARKGREALFALMALDKARLAAEKREAEAASAQRAASAARRKANALRELRKRGSCCCSCGGEGRGALGDGGAAVPAMPAKPAAMPAAAAAAASEEEEGRCCAVPCAVCVCAERQSSLALAESELAGLTHTMDSSSWEQSVLAFARRLSRGGGDLAASTSCSSLCGPGRPVPLATTAGGKAARTAIHQILRRAPLGEVLDCRTDAQGRLVVVALGEEI